MFSRVSCFTVWLLLCAAAQASPVHLRCEYRENPLGIDAQAPHFSWRADNTERNWTQSAYQILVSSTADNLKNGNADIWDSGKQTSSESAGIPYGGPPLQSRKRYYWTVRTWDANAQPSQSSETAWWEMGLLQKSDWAAKWITRKNPEDDTDRSGMRWIWVPGQDALNATPKTVAVFQTTFKLRENPKDAVLLVFAHGDFKTEINGRKTGHKKGWHAFDREDVTGELKAGKNTITIAVTLGEPNSLGPDAGMKAVKAGMAALLKVTQASGSVLRFPSGVKWKARVESAQDWRKAAVVADMNDQRLGPVPPLPQPAALLRRSFDVAKAVESARLYATALGSYRAFVNGKRIGEDVLTPGFTDYSKRVQYQTYDVTSLVVPGKNSIGVILGEGWFGSPMTWTGLPYFFQPPPARLLAQLVVNYSDGTRDTIASDESWKTSESPILHSEIYSGEIYDARNEVQDWNQNSFDESKWPQAVVSSAPAPSVVSQVDEPPRIIQTLTPASVSSVKGAYIADMGQNMVGWATLKVTGSAGTRVRMRFAERLNPDGSIYTDNLRNADATDTYVLRGGGEESFSPTFTFHGFRYVEITGFPGQPTTSSISGEVASSVAGDPTAKVVTASDLVNHMWLIGTWGQRGNFLSIPTDCPQRDERLGWMGDAGVFWRTGSYNFDIDAFSHKFMRDVADGQTPAGNFTNVSPDSLRPFGSEGAPGWADAGVIIPWTTWLHYGDRFIIEENWQAMQRFMDFILKSNPDFIRKNGVGPNFADWLAPDEHTNKDLLATAYWAVAARMMSQMAHAVGKEDDAKRYSDLIENIRGAFQKAYIKEDGTVGTGTQTSYVVALYTKMAPEPLEPTLVQNLVKDIESRSWHLSTGFLGTPFLLATLAEHGRTDVAYRLLLNDTYPSWGYMLSKGATTWWERWNGDTGDPGMNSYNHYAFGSVIAWVYRYVAGIDTAQDGPGFQHIIIHPHPDASMTHASGQYESAYGDITTDWTGGKSSFSLKVTIPPNTSADVYLPNIPAARVTESGNATASQVQGAAQLVHIGSGTYEFHVSP